MEFSIPWIFARLKQIIIVFKTLPGHCFQNSVYQATDESEASRECVEDQLRKMDRVWAGQLINSSWSAKIWIISWSDLVLWSNMREPANTFQGSRAPQRSLCFLFINNHEFSIFSIKSINYSASTQSGLFNRQNAPLADFWNNTVADRSGLKTCRKTKCNG